MNHKSLAPSFASPVQKDLFNRTHFFGINMLFGLREMRWEGDRKSSLGQR